MDVLKIEDPQAMTNPRIGQNRGCELTNENNIFNIIQLKLYTRNVVLKIEDVQ